MTSPETIPVTAAENLRDKGSLAYVIAVTFVAAVGGLLFGFDTGVISGAITFVTEHFSLNTYQEGFAVSSLMIACAIGALGAGSLSDRFGRKKILILAALLFTVSAVLSAVPRTFTDFVAARFIGGLAVGIASVVSPMYIAEISPARIRGRLVSLNQLAIVVGVLSSFTSNWLLVDIGPNNWRWMLAVGAFPAALFFFALMLIPESPRWLVKRGKVGKALVIFSRVDGREHAEREVCDVLATVETKETPFSELFQPGLRKVLVIGVLLALFAHITGIDIITYYGPVIFMKAGFEHASSALLAAVIIGITNLVFTLVGISMVDRFGRRPILLIGLLGMGISMALTGFTFESESIAPAWVLIPILSYIAFFAMSVAMVIWVYTAEIFPNRIRGRAMSVATMVLWLSNVVVTQTFPWMMEKFAGVTFYVYAVICFIAVAWGWFMVRETKGKTLEEIEGMWA